MKRSISISFVRQAIAIVSLTGAVGLATGCSTRSMHTQTVPNADYRAALDWTDPAKYTLPAPGSAEEAAMIDSITSLFGDYSRENLSKNITEVYADEVYFRDAFRQLSTNEAIRDYMLAGLEPLEGAEFVFNQFSRKGGDFYLDWTMRLDFKSTPTGTWEESIGITKVRFNSEGKVIFHQDYWDPTDIVYRRIPIAKQLIGYVKKKM